MNFFLYLALICGFISIFIGAGPTLMLLGGLIMAFALFLRWEPKPKARPEPEAPKQVSVDEFLRLTKQD